MGLLNSFGKCYSKSISNYEREVERKIDSMERNGEVTSEQANRGRNKLHKSCDAGRKICSTISKAGR